jgi:hypothetical protein
MITAHHLVVVVIRNTAPPPHLEGLGKKNANEKGKTNAKMNVNNKTKNINIKTHAEEEAAVLMTLDPLEDIGMVTIGVNVIIKTPLRLEVEMTDSRDISMIKVITIINEDTSIVGAG